MRSKAVSTLSKTIITILAVAGFALLILGLQQESQFLPWCGVEMLLMALIALGVARRHAILKDCQE